MQLYMASIGLWNIWTFLLNVPGYIILYYDSFVHHQRLKVVCSNNSFTITVSVYKMFCPRTASKLIT